MTSERGVKMATPPEVCTKVMQHAVACFLESEEMKRAEVYRQFTAKYGQNCLPLCSGYEWIEMFKSSRTSVVDANKDGHHAHKRTESNK